MGTIIVVAEDPIFGAVLADRLRVGDHIVSRLESTAAIGGELESRHADLLILDLEVSADSEFDEVKRLRDAPASRAVPILVMSMSATSSDRVAALRAGADEFLSKPCDLEEIVLRANRLVTQPSALAASVLQGDLADYPVWEFMQFLQQSRKTGDLQVVHALGAGSVRIERGQVAAARWDHVEGREAVLAILGFRKGRFKFISQTAASEPAESMEDVSQILLQAAWIDDELETRRAFLPATGVSLRVVSSRPKRRGSGIEHDSLPMREVCEALSARPGQRVFDLIRTIAAAPQAIRLAVAVLVEIGMVAVPEDVPGADEILTTSEISTAEIIESAVDGFLAAARHAGFGTSALPIAVLVGGKPWPRFLTLLQSVPGYAKNPALSGFVDGLENEGRNQITLASELGKLSIVAMRLTAANRDFAETAVTVSAAVLIWLEDIEDIRLTRELVDRLEQQPTQSSGLVIVDPSEEEWGRSLVDDTSRWKLGFHEPNTLLGVFGLLRPRGNRGD